MPSRSCALLLAIAVVASGCSSSSRVADHIYDTYPFTRLGADGVQVFASDRDPAGTAEQIRQDFRDPEQSATSAGAVYLLYRDATVAITPAGAGSQIEVDPDNNRAYTRHRSRLGGGSNWFVFVRSNPGHMRPSYGSGARASGGGFRGGGPGAGK